MTEKLGVNEKEPAFGQKTPTTTSLIVMGFIYRQLFCVSVYYFIVA